MLQLKEGYRWRIGYGKNIKVMDESWLKNKGMFHSHDYNNYMLHNLCVKDLLLQDHKMWNVQVVSYLFHEDKANLFAGSCIHLSYNRCSYLGGQKEWKIFYQICI